MQPSALLPAPGLVVNLGPGSGQGSNAKPWGSRILRLGQGKAWAPHFALSGWAIFKSLWFEQEAIIKVFLGKAAFAEGNYSPSLG